MLGKNTRSIGKLSLGLVLALAIYLIPGMTGIVDAIAEAIESVAHLEPSLDELVVAVGEVFQALVEGEEGGETLH